MVNLKKSDYVWLDPDTGRLECWLNNMPDGFVRAGTHEKGVIAAGTVAAERVYLAVSTARRPCMTPTDSDASRTSTEMA